MKKNMSNADALIRIIIAAGISIAYFTQLISGMWTIILLIVAAIFLLTSSLRFCPLYALFGIKTCKTE